MNFQIDMWRYPTIIIKDLEENLDESAGKRTTIREQFLKKYIF